jgi:PadR family transcriptional regulator, regulatory protein PadR
MQIRFAIPLPHERRRIDFPCNHNLFSYIYQMRRRDYLGSFELMVLLTVMHLGEDAYGVPISEELEAETGHEIAVASVYAALQRLEDKGLVNSRFGDPTPERGGRAKKFFKVTGKGLREARNTHRALTRLWRNIPQLEGGTT